MDGGNRRQVEGDFVDNLPPGYRFCPTDSELIVHYLNPKIQTEIRPPSCRLYEVNLYNYGPDELSSQPQYRDCDGTWYFLTPLERKYPNGGRPNRRTKGENGGSWKASQKFTTVYDDVDRRKVVGTKRSLAYHDKNNRKTEWLMYEYTTDRPDLRTGTNMLNTWVLCKIYKKEKKTDGNNQPEQVPNTSNQADENGEQNQPPQPEQVSNTSNQADENGEQNQPLDAVEPSPRRRKVSKVAQSSSMSPTGQTMLNATNSFRSSDGASSSTPTEPLAIVAPPTDNMMATCQYPVTSTNSPNWDIASVNSTGQTMYNATYSFRSSNATSSSTLAEPLLISAVPPQPPTDNMMVPMYPYPVNSTNFPNWDIVSVNSTGQTMLNATKSFQSSNSAWSCTPTEPLPIAAVPPQPPTDNMMVPMYSYPVNSTNFPNWDVVDNYLPQPHTIYATGSRFEEGLTSYHAYDHWFSLEELLGPNF